MNSDYKIKRYTQDNNPESHFHEFYEVYISLTNTGNFFVGSQAYPLSVGTVFFLQPFEIHHCFCHGNQEYDRYIIQFSQEHLRALSTKRSDLAMLFKSAPTIQHISDECLADILSMLTFLMKPCSESFGADIEKNLHFDLFLLTLANSISSAVKQTGINVRYDRRTDEIISYIHEHYSEDITLDSLSNRFFISKSRLSQIFKNTTGFSVGNYIIIYRLKYACILLAEGESVQNVGQMVGFNNNTHFIRMFKKHVGCSPGRFSRDISKEQKF